MKNKQPIHRFKCTCLWSKDDKYGFISNINCPAHGKQSKELIKKSIPYKTGKEALSRLRGRN